MDKIDKQILNLLEENSRIKVKEIAELVHLSAPTVSQRLIKLEEDQIITKYTIQTNLTKTGYPIHSFILISMVAISHKNYLSYVAQYSKHVVNHYRTSGLSCYLLEVRFENNDLLKHFLENLNDFANYSVLSVINHL